MSTSIAGRIPDSLLERITQAENELAAENARHDAALDRLVAARAAAERRFNETTSEARREAEQAYTFVRDLRDRANRRLLRLRLDVDAIRRGATQRAHHA
jgi:hypothetical protein